MAHRWSEESGDARAVLTDLPAGVVLTRAPRGIELSVEGAFRYDVPELWAGWPPEWTTDGMVADLMWRSHTASVGVAGRLWIDFASNVIPVMAVFTTVEHEITASLHVGGVDPRTGRAQAISSDRPLLLDGSPDGVPTVPHRTVGRRLVPVEWTQVAVVRPWGLEAV